MRYRRAMLCAAAVACVFFACVMLILGIAADMAAYTVFVYAFIILVFIIFDLQRYSGKIKRLSEIAENISCTNHEYPEQENNIEQLYSGIITELYELMDRERAELSASHSEQTDYYTMWLHQIKTPIAAMRLVIDSDASASPIYREELFKIERYVEMALQYARMNSISGDLLPESCELDAVITACIKKYSTLFIGKGLGVDFQRTGMTVTTDSKWLAFVIEQFISNAVKYTQTGEVKIYARDGRLVIEDTGIGILPQDAKRVFERGYTGRNGRIDERASGLGLYMASRVAETLELKLEMDSRPGRGTRISITFPARESTPE